MDEIEREEGIHGGPWDALHDGYFADPAVARPLVQKIVELAAASKARVLADLGGGTGYVLSQLRAGGMGPQVSLVNLEYSHGQLAAARGAGLMCVRGSVDTFRRGELGPENEHFLFAMRSVLHYFGQDGLRRLLRHVRAQARGGEFFVHQTASFRDPRDADCLNALYRMMRTQKWYPTVGFLHRCLADEGWKVIEVLPSPPLVLTAEDLARRYSLDEADISRIRDCLSRDFPGRDGAFTPEGSGFRAFLHYWIYVCSAAPLDS
jgi:hypothetical protein